MRGKKFKINKKKKKTSEVKLKEKGNYYALENWEFAGHGVKAARKAGRGRRYGTISGKTNSGDRGEEIHKGEIR